VGVDRRAVGGLVAALPGDALFGREVAGSRVSVLEDEAAAGPQVVTHRGQRGALIVVAEERLEGVAGHEREAEAVRERERAAVGHHVLDRQSDRLLSRALDHVGGDVDADAPQAAAGDWNREPAGAAREIEDRAAVAERRGDEEVAFLVEGVLDVIGAGIGVLLEVRMIDHGRSVARATSGASRRQLWRSLFDRAAENRRTLELDEVARARNSQNTTGTSPEHHMSLRGPRSEPRSSVPAGFGTCRYRHGS